MGGLLQLPSPIPAHDLFFILAHATVDSVAIVENIVLLLAILFRSPSDMRSYSVLLLYTTVIDIITALASILTIMRIIPAGGMIAYVYDGPCVLISSYFCHCLVTLTVGAVAQSLFLVAFSIAYRLYVLERKTPRRWQVFLICFSNIVPTAALLTPFLFSLDDQGTIRQGISAARPDYQLDEYVLEGNLSIYSWSVLFLTASVSAPGVPMAIVVLVLRAKVLSKLEQKASGMSVKTERMHRTLTKVLTLQATLPIVYIFGATNYLLCQSDIICSPVQEHLIMQLASIIPLISPAITLFYVRPYRVFVEEKVLCRNKRGKTSVVSASLALQ